jgi:hypothetical protein
MEGRHTTTIAGDVSGMTPPRRRREPAPARNSNHTMSCGRNSP